MIIVNSVWMPVGYSQEIELPLYGIKEGLVTGQAGLPSGVELERCVLEDSVLTFSVLPSLPPNRLAAV